MDGDSTETWTAAAAFRGTEEYAAAFDLEVWKAQQQARLRAELQEERARLHKSIAEEVRRVEERRLAELDALRRDLDDAARRLRVREEALQRRAAQLEAREAAFEDRRVRVAEAHESHLAAVEHRVRRQLDESAAARDALAAELRERDASLERRTQRLRAAEGDRDAWQRAAAKGTPNARLAELEAALTEARAAHTAAAQTLRERDAALLAAQRERAELADAVRRQRAQWEELARENAALRESGRAREEAALAAERRRLAARATRHAFGANADGECRALLRGLRADVMAGLRPRPKAQPVRVVLAETDHAANVSVSTLSHRDAESEGRRGARGGDAQMTSTTTTATTTAPYTSPRTALVDHTREMDVSSSYGYAEVESWHSEEHPPLPPLAPTRHREDGPPQGEEAFGERGGEGEVEEGDAREVGIGEGLVEEGDATHQSAREEMIAFVEKMRINRQKLLESGAYDQGDPLLQEMTEKIALYEQFLSQNFGEQTGP